MTIEVQFSCKRCGVNRHRLAVPARLDDVDVRVWMDATVRLVGKEHRRLSPTCQAKGLSELLIPMPPGSDRVGGVSRN